MLVCHCLGVSDRVVKRVVREGAVTVADVGRACGAGTCCGGCRPSLQDLIRAEAVQRESGGGTAAPGSVQAA